MTGLTSAAAISVVICTRNRAHALTRCLEYLERVRFDRSRCELVIVDNGSTDDTAAVVERFRAVSSWKVAGVHENGRGSSRAKNAGVAASTGDIIAFTDDDCYVAEDYLERISSAFDDSMIGYIGGRILLHDPSDAPVTIKLETEGNRILPHTFLIPGEMHGANIAARRSVIRAVGGFDPMFGAGERFTGEDVDFLVRASLNGWTGAYVPDVVVAHHHGRKPGRDVERLVRTYAHGNGAYFAKFLLNPASRSQCARHWYWLSLNKLKTGKIGLIFLELRGAMHYLLRRAVDGP